MKFEKFSRPQEILRLDIPNARIQTVAWLAKAMDEFRFMALRMGP